jgi:hypothetical protein
MSVGAPPHDPPATKSSRADCASYRRPRPGQRLDQPVKEASIESAKVGGEESVGGGKPEGEASWEGRERGGERGRSRKQKRRHV